MTELIDKLEKDGILSKEEFVSLLKNRTTDDEKYAAQKARSIADSFFGNKIYLRGLIEFTNYCKNDCLYCGIRRSNTKAERYRLTKDQILECCSSGYELGYRTFVLQGGEDPYFTDERMIEIIRSIRAAFPDCAITLSIGEKSEESYRAYFAAGADRYLLRHETATVQHYEKLHPKELSLENRINCLKTLKRIGFQTGCGFMIGSPYQTPENIANDLIFIHELKPQMVGMGPFIPHAQTPFADNAAGTLRDTLFLLSLVRIMEKNVLLPATTALATIDPKGRELGILAGANVVMPNLSPVSVREKYKLYDGKVCTGDEAAECRRCMEKRLNSIGFETVVSRGDYIGGDYAAY